MRNIKLVLMYEGTRYFGFASQREVPTIVGELKRSLKELFGSEMAVIGASRTDRGVHALGQVVNFKCDLKIEAGEFLGALNYSLPKDIRILKSEDADDGFHARFSARSKEYCYSVFVGREIPFNLKNYALHVRQEVDLSDMRKAADGLVGEHDFSSFSQGVCNNPTRRIDSIAIDERPHIFGKLLEFSFRGNGFLYKMIRSMVGTLIEVGLKKRDPDKMREILEACDRRRAGKTAPAQGLCLVRVKY